METEYNKKDGTFNHVLFISDSIKELKKEIAKCKNSKKLLILKSKLNYLLKD